MVKINLDSYTYKFMKARYARPRVGPPLTIELIPKSCQGNSLYHKWPTKWWDKLRRMVYRRSNHKCEICGAGPKVECHEVWDFDIETRTQRLLYLVCLCHDCHRAKHVGRAIMTGSSVDAVLHLMKINRWSLDFTLSYIDRTFIKHKKYKGIIFKKKMDLRLLDDFIDKFKIKNRRKKRVKAKSKTKKREVREINKSVGNYKRGYKR